MGNTRRHKGDVKMSEARDKYLKNLETYDCEYFGCQAEDYVAELEQQITELKESQKQKQIIKLCERLDEAERQNKQMLEAINKTYAEFERIKNNADVSLKDRIYLDGVLAILDVKLKQPIESVTGKPIDELLK